MSKHCANCGDGIPKGTSICDNCGMPVSEAAPPQQAPPQQASPQRAITHQALDRPPPPPLAPAEESKPPLWRPEQGEPLASSQVTLPGSAPDEDQNGAERRRGVPRWVTRAAGFAGTAVAALAGMAVFWRRGINALERKPDADSATQQDMGVAAAPVQDTVPSDQVEANLDPIGGLAPDDAATEPGVIDAIEQDPTLIGRMQRDPAVLEDLATTAAETHQSSGTTPPTKVSQVREPATTEPDRSTLDPELLDPTAAGPTLDTGLIERIEQNPELVEAVNRDEDVARALERDPASVDQIEQDLGLAAEQGPAEPSGVTESAGAMEPEVPEPDPVDQDLDD